MRCAAAVRKEMSGATREAAGARSSQAFARVPASGIDPIRERRIHCVLYTPKITKSGWRVWAVLYAIIYRGGLKDDVVVTSHA